MYKSVGSILLLWSSFATAQTPAPSPTPEPKAPIVTTVAGQPVSVDFQDGRIAVVKKSAVSANDQLSIPFQVFDSLCADARGMSCVYRLSFRTVFYFLAWSQHPDAAKVNQPLKRIFPAGTVISEEGRKIENSDFYSGTEGHLFPVVTQGLPVAQVECDDFSWLPTKTKEAPAALEALRWDSEMMMENPETGVNENRTTGGGAHISLRRSSPRSLAISSVGAFTSQYGFNNGALVVGDVSTMTLDDQKGGYCSVELKPGGLADVTAQVRNLKSQRVDPAKETNIYLYGSDEASFVYEKNVRSFASGLSNLLQNVKSLKAAEVE